MIKEIDDLKDFKKRSQWSDEKIATRMGVSTQSIRNWFKGRSEPSDLARKAIREFLFRAFTETKKTSSF